jgi:enamine deaminase RidA (YjgF/YER057c/UK114 family)
LTAAWKNWASPCQSRGPPPGVVVPASLIKVRGKGVVISGHVPTDADGSIAGPLGRVGDEVSPEQAYEAARRSLISILAVAEGEDRRSRPDRRLGAH